MNNEKVIKQFLNKRCGHTPTREIINGYYTYKGQTLSTDGNELINYSTRIAYHENGKLYINMKKYSQTTSKIQGKLRFLANQMNYKIIEYED